tara:strand:- start:377 stop:553 length:177 start_codon:yes stop_codon:yes gene_type:complete
MVAVLLSMLAVAVLEWVRLDIEVIRIGMAAVTEVFMAAAAWDTAILQLMVKAVVVALA